MVGALYATEYPDFTKLIAENQAAVVSINASGERRSRDSESIPVPGVQRVDQAGQMTGPEGAPGP